MRFIRNWKISLPVGGVVLAGLAWLAFGFFGIHTAFIDNEVEEALPEFDVPAAPIAAAAEPDDLDVPEEDVVASPDEPVGAAVSDGDANEAPAAEDATPAVTEPPVVTEAPAVEAAQPVIVTEASGSFAGINDYAVVGDALVLGNGTGQRFLRFENFESDNGPDLNVYLINPDDPNDFVDLGDLSGNIGDQNYEIGADIDLERYSQVGIWCVRFSVGFGVADLTLA